MGCFVGGVLDIAEATNSFYHELAYPTVVNE